MFETIKNFFKKYNKQPEVKATNSGDAAKERLHLVLMQDRANVSADFLELMKQEIIDVIKKYIEIDESAIDVRLTNKENADGTNGAPALYANIPIVNIKNETLNEVKKENKKQDNVETKEEIKEKDVIAIDKIKEEQGISNKKNEKVEEVIIDKEESKEEKVKKDVKSKVENK